MLRPRAIRCIARLLCCPKVLLLSILLAAGSAAPQTAERSKVEDLLVTLSKQRFTAFAAGDRATLQQMIADDAIFMYSDGRSLNKRQMLDAVAKFPGTYEIHYEDVQVRNFRSSAMVCFRLVYRDSTALDPQPIQYLETDTFALRNGRWLMVGVHGTAVPYPEAHEIAVTLAMLDAYVGDYEARDQHYTITRVGNQLFGQRSGYPKAQWHAESQDLFFVDGDSAGRRIFVRDEAGRVSQMIRVGPEHYAIWTRSKP